MLRANSNTLLGDGAARDWSVNYALNQAVQPRAKPFILVSYYRQFEFFHPLEATPALLPLHALRDIVWRARKMLQLDATLTQMVAIAQTVNWIIDGSVTVASSIAEEDGNAPHDRRDLSDTHWLKERIFLYDMDPDPDSDLPGYHQCFAVLAIWKVADANFCIQPEFGAGVHDAFSDKSVAEQWMAAANYAIDAMEAVGFAEVLHERYLADQLSVILQSTVPTTDEIVREKIALRAQQAAIKKHAGNHAARSRALELYRTRRYTSVEAAAQAIAPMVAKAPRTIAKWLYDERKGRTPALPTSSEATK